MQTNTITKCVIGKDQKRLFSQLLAVIFLVAIGLPVNLLQAQNDTFVAKHVADQSKVVQNNASAGLVSIKAENMNLIDALELVASKLRVGISYSAEKVPNKMVSVNFHEAPVFKVLEKLLEGTNLEVILPPSNDVIVLREKVAVSNEMDLQVTVTGQVRDAQNSELLQGVNIVVQGTTIGTTTDLNGEYSLTVPSGDVNLIFSIIGYVSVTVAVDNRTEINIQLAQDVQLFEDIVVIGYGSVRRSDITGAVTSISPRAIEDNPNISDAGQALIGRASGVDVVPAGNRPGDGVSIRIRGRRSFEAGNDPLFVVDGIPISGGLNQINPKDIESINILKDASATAIYGSRGANGVIIITTKRGVPGQVRVSVDSQLGVNQVRNAPNLYDGEGWFNYRKEAWAANGITNENLIFEQQFRDNYASGTEFDWFDLVTQDGLTQEHNIGVSGGSEDTRFNVAVGFLDTEGVTPLQDFQRLSARLNLDQNVSERIRFGVGLITSFSTRNGENYNPYGNMQAGIPNGAYNEPPFASPFDADGELKLRTSQEPDAINPLADQVDGKYIERREITRILGSFYAEFDILENLSFRTIFGPDLRSDRLGDFRGRFTTASVEGDPRASQRRASEYEITWENLVNYQTVFAGSHNVDFTGLFGIQVSRNEFSTASVLGIPVESFQMHNLGSASEIQSVGSGFERRSLMSYMGRANYNYQSRYLLTVTARADGSSKFAEGNQWGFFPSVALGWNLSNESFMQGNNLFSNLALRVSYGKTGNEGIAPFQTESVLSRSSYNWGGGASAFGFRPTRIQNDDLKWETTSTFNVGVDYEVLEGRIGGSVEFYSSRTTDLLLLREIPWTTGFGSVLTNVGIKSNTGFEFSVSTFNITPSSTGGFSWSTDLNLFTNVEKIVELAQGKVDDIGNRRFIGQPATVFYDFEKIGIWQLGEEAAARANNSAVGGVRVASTNPEDRIIVGTDVPSLIGGMTHRFAFKGFDLAIVANARLGHTIQSAFHGGGIFHTSRGNHLVTDYWTADNPNAEFPRPHAGLQRPYYDSTLRYFDGSFVKIQSINLGYMVDQNIASSLGMNSLRLFINVTNPYVFSSYVQKYGGLDPETSMSPIPQARTIMGGWSIIF